MCSDVDLGGVRRGAAAAQPRGPRLAGGGRADPRRGRAGRRVGRGPVAPCDWSRSASDDEAGPGAGSTSGHDGLERARPGRGSRRVERQGLRRHRRAEPPRAAAADRAPSGAAYLQRRSASQATARATADEESPSIAAGRSTTSSRGSLSRARPLAPQDPRLSGRSEPMILNGAYLVRRRRPVTASRRPVRDARRGTSGRSRSRCRGRGRRTPSPSWSRRDAGTWSARRGRARPRRPGRSPWSTCSTGCSGTGVVLAGDVVISLSGVDLVADPAACADHQSVRRDDCHVAGRR